MSFIKNQSLESAMPPLDYSQALERFLNNNNKPLHFNSIVKTHCKVTVFMSVVLCAGLQSGWKVSCTPRVLSFCCCCSCLFLFLGKHHSCFFSFWHNRKSIWQVCFTVSLKCHVPWKQILFDKISKHCSKLTDSHRAGVLGKEQSK